MVDVEKRRNPSKHYVSTAPTPLPGGWPGTPGWPLAPPAASPGAKCAPGSLAVEFRCRAAISRGAFLASSSRCLPQPRVLFFWRWSRPAVPWSVPAVKSSPRLSGGGWWGKRSSDPRREALLGKSISPALPGGADPPRTQTRMLSEAGLGGGSHALGPPSPHVRSGLCLPRPGLGSEGSRCAPCPASALRPELGFPSLSHCVRRCEENCGFSLLSLLWT